MTTKGVVTHRLRTSVLGPWCSRHDCAPSMLATELPKDRALVLPFTVFLCWVHTKKVLCKRRKGGRRKETGDVGSCPTTAFTTAFRWLTKTGPGCLWGRGQTELTSRSHLESTRLLTSSCGLGLLGPGHLPGSLALSREPRQKGRC